ncbi:hypothetical protein [Pedobacter kyonggii]|uniref:DUF3575 domain-containing protein n=1 Tax=Pedobacter kyonggii TaxID=1926871 RepID=A0A4Q9HEP5_9SPHI|nr:hypothetical protein [Pedobacter kyonggii]TBO43300.1 hypothetical protein EYS08_08130 [Pedobacter kyonggii]
MKKIIFLLAALALSLPTFSQTSADYNFSLGLKAYSIMQLPKVLNQTNYQDFKHTYANALFMKFNDNQISYRIGGNFYRKSITFPNTCASCEIAEGILTDFAFKVGFEKNFTYSRFQPYFGMDLGYRSNRFSGNTYPGNTMFVGTARYAESSKNGLVISPIIGVKLNLIPLMNLFAESSLDYFYSYERQESTEPNGTSRTVNTYQKSEFLLNLFSAGVQFNISRRN